MATARIDATFTNDDGQQFRVTGDLTVTPAAADQPPAEPTDPAGGLGADVPPLDQPDPGAQPAGEPGPAEPATEPAPEPGTDVPPAGEPGGPEQPAEQPAEQPVDPTTASPDNGGNTDPATGAGPTAGGNWPPFPGELRRDDQQRTPDDNIRAWQQAAADNGITVGPVDGFFGPRTQSGVVALQNTSGLPLTGVIDEATWQAAWTATATA